MNNLLYLEIIFSGRNKEYGAYELRKNYEKRLKLSLLVVLFSLTSLIAVSLSFKGSDKISVNLKSSDVTLQKVIMPTEKPKAQEIKRQERKVQSVKYTPPVIVQDDQAKESIPEERDIEDSQISTKNVTGEKDTGTVMTGQIAKVDTIPIEGQEPETVFEKVEIEASFPGGIEKWRRYLERNCDPDVAIQNGAPAGTYTVIVQFIVDTEGNISSLQSLTSHGYGMEAEAERIITKGPRWNPAVQNGLRVKSYKRQPITFRVLQD